MEVASVTVERTPVPAPEHEQAGAPTGAYPPVYRSLMTVGLLAAVYGCHEEADIVGDAVERTLTQPLFYRLHRALAQGIGGHAGYAVEHLGEHLRENPCDDAAKLCLAVSLMFSGDAGWKPLIENILASSSEPDIRAAAVNMVEFLAKHRQ